MKTIGFAMCGSFCTFEKSLAQLEFLAQTYNILPLMSQTAYETDTRFGKAADWVARLEQAAGREVLHTLVQAEPIGPKGLVDAMVVCPCTGNTLSKIAAGITDTPVTMAVKSSLRIGIPVVLCCATNDAMAASGPNLLRLLNTKNVYLVPLRQDDPVKKPVSLVADFSLLPRTIALALEGRQLQPVFLPPQTGG
ncbi:dipicolinate synthase subunit B [Acutalibacter sp. LFL-21]|uniref:dipicolinate synthase subunit B n=1 Tax=Acutalibacter sp. LFL-21 TaxID=2983399 RepID=UPI0021D68CC0|nr:dipicolinate synthase subunit B [Acutalibacter sp. LFL-21]MCU7652423.1 dipicolinate synthase subunit B [Acutalibacter sp. LFL-21]